MEKLVLIHGALGAKSEFDSTLSLLKDKYNVMTYEVPHHGELKNSDIKF